MKVGDYVRYEYENCIYIGKIKFISEVMGYEETLQLDIDDCMEEILKEDIIKSSPNIIDLIEVGDYVNGEQVSRIKQCPEYHLGDGILIFNEHNETIYSNFRTSKYYDITSIVTKESMERVTYYVK